jgi:hypothetical protein
VRKRAGSPDYVDLNHRYRLRTLVFLEHATIVMTLRRKNGAVRPYASAAIDINAHMASPALLICTQLTLLAGFVWQTGRTLGHGSVETAAIPHHMRGEGRTSARLATTFFAGPVLTVLQLCMNLSLLPAVA